MTVRALPFVPCLVLVALAPAALGVNPLDNDAGSGGDAPDVKPLALAVPFGTHQGRLFNTVDGTDWYAFPVTAGQLLEVDVDSGFWFVIGWIEDSAGELQGVSWGSPFRAFIEHDDTWYLKVTTSTLVVENGNPSVPLIPPSYRFSISSSAPETVLVFHSDDDWAALEVAWNQTAFVFAQARIEITSPPVTDQPLGCTIQVEGSGQQPGGGYAFQGALSLGGGAFSNVVRVTPGPVPEQSAPVPEAAQGDGWAMTSFTINGGTGSLRYATYCTAAAHATSFLVVSDAPLASATAAGAGLMVWNEYNAGADEQILTPAASATGERTRSDSMDSSFVGFLQASDQSEVYAVDPGGVRHDPMFGNRLFLVDLAAGTWSFHIGPTTGAGVDAVRNNLEGAFVPFLGVSEPVVFPMF